MTLRRCCCALVLASAIVPGRAVARQASSPLPVSAPPLVVAELFTSEGCSSCPPADTLLSELASGSAAPGIKVIVLSEHVDYWDHLGWRDPFSSASFSARQTDYDARVFRANNIYTPQLVIDGRRQVIGSDRAKVVTEIAAAARAPKATLLVRARQSADGSKIEASATGGASVTVDWQGQADIVFAVTEDRLANDVKAGENGGHRLTHTGVVRVLRTMTAVSADRTLHRDITVPLEPGWNPSHLSVVVLLQERATRRIVGAGSATLTN
jgi:hypothetical protein